ncbi:MAG: glycosyltransferase [Acidobacteria bacterium]|nr:glycosyltransferase [Acidobacteriota bacterium]
MADDIEVSVVLPTFNEAGNIASLIERVGAALADVAHEILVMDDRSPDGTAALAREAGAGHPRVRVVERQPPAGLTLSIFDGVQRARGTFVAWMDCDFSHPPELLPELLAPLRRADADVACASRYVHGGADNRSEAPAVFASLAITKLARWFIDRRVLDYTTGYVMAPRALLLELGLHGDYGEYCIELLGTAALRGYRVLEVPYVSISRVEGESKTATNVVGFVRRGWRYLVTIGRLWLSRRQVAARGVSPGTTTRDLGEQSAVFPDPSSGRSEERAKT